MRARLGAPIDGASLAAFRVLFGAVMTVALVRTLASGWIDETLVEPTFFFKYRGAEWMPVWGPIGLYAHVGATAACALLMTVGLLTRWATVGFLVGFATLQLMDLTNYLNHYYLVVLLAALLAVMPTDRCLAVRPTTGPVPAWTLSLLRFQVGCVYVFAALAKVTGDWLLHAQPLGIWLSARGDLPVIGPLLGHPWAPWIMSWAGLLYDGTIVAFLLWARTRRLAYGAVLTFHGLTWLLFDIGMFPLIMIVATTVFFAPDWPRRWLDLAPPVRTPRPPRRVTVALIALWLSAHLALPLRHLARPGHVLWGEQGMRFSWRVLVRAKHGAVTFDVRAPETGRRFVVSPSRYLRPRQESEMSGQPDLIAQLARHIAADFRRRGYGAVQVRAEAWVSLNGRPPALLLDPRVDLAALPPSDLPAAINPMPTTAPLPVKGRAPRR